MRELSNDELAALGKQMWAAARAEKDPVLKMIYALIHKQTVELRKPDHEQELADLTRGTKHPNTNPRHQSL